MLFPSVLIALLVERLAVGWRPRRRHRWFAAYWRRVSAVPAAQRLLDSTWGLAVLLLPPLLLLALIVQLAAALGVLVELAVATLVLIYSLGPRELRSDVEAYAEAEDAGDAATADRRALALCGETPPRDEPERSVAIARGVLGDAATRLFGPLLWFVLLGPVGAAAYRLVHLLATTDDHEDDAATARHADELRWLADWLPVRAGLATYAAAGNFDAVRRVWQARPGGDDEPDDRPGATLLGDAGLAALGVQDAGRGVADDGSDDDTTAWCVDEALGLVWRSLLVWLAILGLASLVAWID
jgi:AmpE protein